MTVPTRETNWGLSRNGLELARLKYCVRVPIVGIPSMQVGHATSEPVIAWWLDVKGVGESLRERYKVPKELPPKLLEVARELDAIEGNQLLGSSGMPPDYEQMLEARIVVGVKAFPDWFVLT